MNKPTRPTLRATLRELAIEIGCSHSALSAAARRGALTDGIARDHRGRVIVIDAKAAAAQWRKTFVPRIDSRPAKSADATEAASRIWLTDPYTGFWVSVIEVIEARDMSRLLVAALVSAAVDVADRKAATTALRRRIAKRLRVVAEWHGADDSDIARAKRELDSVLEMLEWSDEDEDEP